jgi:hypothetical protein
MHHFSAMQSQLKMIKKQLPCASDGLLNERIPLGEKSQRVQKTIRLRLQD